MTDFAKEIMRLRDNAGFLGYEFLTWCFLLLDRDDALEQMHEIAKNVVPNQKPELVLGQRMVTCLLNHKDQKTSLKTPLLEASYEAFASIRNGHLIESLALELVLSDLRVSFCLHAQDFALTQVQIKSNFDEESLTDNEDSLNELDKNREEIFLRVAALDDTESVINALYEHFLGLRLNEESCMKEIVSMRKQVDKRLGSYLSQTSTKDAANLTELNT